MKNKIEKAEKTLQMVNQWIANCDTKSSFILTFYGVMLTIIFTSKIGEKMLKVLSFECTKEMNWGNFFNFILYIIVIVFLLISMNVFYHIYKTLKGRINSEKYKENELDIQSKIFFVTISKRSFEDFEISSNKETEEEYLKDLHSQTFINSNIATKKFEHYNKSLCRMTISIILLIIFMIFQ